MSRLLRPLARPPPRGMELSRTCDVQASRSFRAWGRQSVQHERPDYGLFAGCGRPPLRHLGAFLRHASRRPVCFRPSPLIDLGEGGNHETPVSPERFPGHPWPVARIGRSEPGCFAPSGWACRERRSYGTRTALGTDPKPGDSELFTERGGRRRRIEAV